MVRAYFSLIQTIANMYTEVSRDYIMKGLRMCDELSKATTTDQPQSVIREKNEMLDDYARDVQFKLCRMVSQVGNRYLTCFFLGANESFVRNNRKHRISYSDVLRLLPRKSIIFQRG